AIELRVLNEHFNLQRRIQLGEDVAALIGKAELLVGGQVPALVLLGSDVVDRDEDSQHDQDADAGQRAVLGLPARKHLGDLAPLAERIRQNADQAGPGKVVRVLFFSRQAESDPDRHEYEQHAQPSDEIENAVQHDLT